jgi:hypothetical protein
MRAACLSGISLAIFTTESTCAVVYSAKVEMPAIWPTSSPSSFIRKLVGSSAREPTSVLAPVSQRLNCPRAQEGQRPQAGRNEKTTWSPTSKPGVFGPTAVTTPAPSWPPQIG